MKKFLIIIFISLVVLIALIFIINIKDSEAKKIYGTASYEAEYVSIINLIADSDKYDGKLIRIQGIGRFEFEGTSIYLSEDSYENYNTKNAIWLDINDDILSKCRENLVKANGKQIIIEGVFNSKNLGHFSLYSGSVENITRIQIL